MGPEGDHQLVQKFLGGFQGDTVYSISGKPTKNHDGSSIRDIIKEEKDLVKRAYDMESYKKSLEV
ncbi:hypothetical protein ACFLWL_03040 [Chloroflexota bacterium]